MNGHKLPSARASESVEPTDFTLIPYVMHVTGHDLVLAGVIGLVAAGLGILLMRGVGLWEQAMSRLRVPAPLRPAIGGLIVGILALVTPQVLASGHGAIHIAGRMRP